MKFEYKVFMAIMFVLLVIVMFFFFTSLNFPQEYMRYLLFIFLLCFVLVIFSFMVIEG